jgi:hypothetical protein
VTIALAPGRDLRRAPAQRRKAPAQGARQQPRHTFERTPPLLPRERWLASWEAAARAIDAAREIGALSASEAVRRRAALREEIAATTR